MDEGIVILGGGGHAVVVADVVRALGGKLIGVIDPDERRVRERLPTERFLSTSEEWLQEVSRRVVLALGMGHGPGQNTRQRLFEKWSRAGFKFPALVHPRSYVSSSVFVAEGVQVMAGATIQPRCHLACGALVNTRVSIDHECRIGPFVHVAPGATICGEVDVGEGAFIGAGSTIIQGKRIGAGGVVAAGAVVVEDVDCGAVLMGVPAKPR